MFDELLILVGGAVGWFAVIGGVRIPGLELLLRDRVGALPEVRGRIERGERLTDDDVRAIVDLARSTR